MKTESRDYYIFGAHPRGYTMYQYLRTLEPDRKNLGFLFDNDEDNPAEIEGVKVFNLNIAAADCMDLRAAVYVSTRGVFHKAIIDRLVSFGFSSENIIPVTPELDTKLRNEYVRKVFAEKGKNFLKIDSLQKPDSKEAITRDISVYIAKTVFDGDFEKPVAAKEYETIIQAGTSLSSDKLSDASFFDNDGENISDRNKQFCELTALYWIWKHADSGIVGLEHWRRRFLLPEDWAEIMNGEQIDVILPVPLCVMPSLEGNYKFRHDEKVWDEAMKIIKELYPEDFSDAVKFFSENNLYSPCNMIIARRDVLNEYCEWLFPVLLELNDRIGVLEDTYQNRYPGFLSERLLNYFFEKNSGRFKIAYADKSFLS